MVVVDGCLVSTAEVMIIPCCSVFGAFILGVGSVYS